MATGDVRAAVAALHTQLRSLRYPHEFDIPAAEAGSPAPLLPALDYVLLRFSKHVALLVAQQGLQLHGTTDLRFIEGVLKLSRDALGIKPLLTPAQILSESYAERKVQLVHSITRVCKEYHNASARKERLAALKNQQAEQRLCPAAGCAPANQQPAGQEKQGLTRRCIGGIPRPPLKQLASTVDVAVSDAQQQHSRLQAPTAGGVQASAALEQPRVVPPSLQGKCQQQNAGSRLSVPAQLALQTIQSVAGGPAAAGHSISLHACSTGQPLAVLEPAQQARQQLVAPAAASSAVPSSSELQTGRLIEELQLRLSMAEQAAAAARQEAQQAREQLQARVTVLEGRVRFLEAGFELRPSQQLQLQYGLQGQMQPTAALPWSMQASGSGIASQAASMLSSPAAAAPWTQPRWQQTQQPAPERQTKLEGDGVQHVQSNPLFVQSALQPESATAFPLRSVSKSAVAALLAAPPRGCGATQAAAPAEDPKHLLLRAAAVAEPAAAAQHGSYGNTSELISGMQARFCEAEDFLHSLQQL